MGRSDMAKAKQPVGLIVCGPCACGKSEIASALSTHYQAPFVDADSYHSEENIKKMSSGIPLTDEDRFPWLVTVRRQMIFQKKDINCSSDSSVAVIAACSALKTSYRNILSGMSSEGGMDQPNNALKVIFVFLNCTESVLQKRLNERQGHFMKANMLSSQLDALELPYLEVAEGRAVIVNGDAELKEVIQEAIAKLKILC